MVADRCRENKGVACVKRRGGKTRGGNVFSEGSIFTRLCNQYTRVRGARRKREEKIDAADITAEVRDNKRKKKKKNLARGTHPFQPSSVKPVLLHPFVSLEEEWKEEEEEIFTRIRENECLISVVIK